MDESRATRRGHGNARTIRALGRGRMTVQAKRFGDLTPSVPEPPASAAGAEGPERIAPAARPSQWIRAIPPGGMGDPLATTPRASRAKHWCAAIPHPQTVAELLVAAESAAGWGRPDARAEFDTP